MSIVQQGPTPNAAAAVPRGLITNLAQTLAGMKTFQDGIVAASLLGASASDVCNKVGTSVVDASVNASAKLLSLRTAIGGSEIEYASFSRADASFGHVLDIDMKSLTNCSGIRLLNASAGVNGLSWGTTGDGCYMGIGSGFMDVISTNRYFKFTQNSGAFSSSPLAAYLFDMQAADAVPLSMFRAASGFAQDLARWRVNTTDKAKIDSAGNYIVPADDGAVKLGSAGATLAGDAIGLYVGNFGSTVGSLRPATTGGGSLGTSGSRWGNVFGVAADLSGQLTLSSFTDDSANPGNRTVNKVRGKSAIAAGAAAVTITNSFVTASSQIIVTLESVDATLTFIKACVPAAGSFTLTCNANATAATKFSWTVIN